MRTDAKIGILVGIVIAVGVVLYIFLNGGEKSAAPPQSPAITKSDVKPAQGSEKSGTSDGGAISFGGIRAKDGENKPEPAPAGQSLKDYLARVEPSPAPKAVEVGKMPEPVKAPTEVTAIKSPGETPSFPEKAKEEAKPTTHTVAEGETLWSIAAKEYKDGGKYPWIVKANPDVEKTPLRPGRKLVIPPLPKEDKPAASGTLAGGPTPTTHPATLGRAGEAPAGGVYVVQSGDTGFWGIAVKEYKDGAKYYLIQKANPNVDPKRLQVGMKLVVPPLNEAKASEATITPGSASVAPKSAASAAQKPPAKRADSASDGRPRFYDQTNLQS